MKNKITELLNGTWENHILPFFWQHGEDDKTLSLELQKIHESGIKAVCVESRPNEKFGEDEWFDDMRLILEGCRERGMDFWLLDDRHFPTGYANGLIKSKYPERGKHAVTERHVDTAGPVKEAAFIAGDNEFIGIVACERVPGDGQRMTGRAIDITENVKDGILFWDVPEGYWRIFFISEREIHDDYIDMLREDSVDVLIEAVYEPHYERLKEYFGTTFKGYFSDEPFIMHEAALPVGDECRPGGCFPWNDNVKAGIADKLGDDWLLKLPSLWFPSENAAETRIRYMDVVTELYSRCFTYRLGDWARAHGVEYIGHIVEDDGMHCQMKTSAGHFFRALDGQDMAGIDVVLCQIVPGMSNNTIHIPCSYNISDHEFFNFGLAKLGSSHSHIQPEKKGRAMCEIFGAYGWAEGLPMMKWLADHMLVRGINEFVPHAFTPKYPDYDCPPHFYAAGHNPEYRGFRKIMDYMNRVSSVLQSGTHKATCALFYHAEAEWSGGKFMKFEKPAKILTENQLDFDVVPEDYIAKANVENGMMCLGNEKYQCIVVPYSEILTSDIISSLSNLADKGVKVVFIDGTPVRDEKGNVPDVAGFEIVSLENLASRMAEFADIKVKGTAVSDLRYYHVSDNENDIYFFTNEGITDTVEACILNEENRDESYTVYYPMENTAFRASGCINIRLEPYNSMMIIKGEMPDVPVCAKAEVYSKPENMSEINEWKISFAEAEAYDPSDKYPTCFIGEHSVESLYNLAKENPRFAGFAKYEAEFESDGKRKLIDLGYVGETADVWVNGKYIGGRIIPPYRFYADTRQGRNNITVVTTSHLAYAKRDGFSSFLTMYPVGLLGPVKIGDLE